MLDPVDFEHLDPLKLVALLTGSAFELGRRYRPCPPCPPPDSRAVTAEITVKRVRQRM